MSINFIGTETGSAIGTELGQYIEVEAATPPAYDQIGNPPLPLQTIIPAYVYQEYADDPNVVAFFNAYNVLAQQYLIWFNTSPLAAYTNPSIAGPLLDWVGNGIYGIARPAYTAVYAKYEAGLNSGPLNRQAINGPYNYKLGAAVLSSDDFYKRILTWWFYLGDSRRFTIMMLRKRVARFIYGVNGTDITVAQAQNIKIALTGFSEPAIKAGINANPINSVALNWYKPHTTHTLPLPSGTYVITVPKAAGVAALYFQQAFYQGLLSFPFQINATVIVA